MMPWMGKMELHFGLLRNYIMVFCLAILTGCGSMLVGGGANNDAGDANYDSRTPVQIRSDAKITSAINSRLVRDRSIDALGIQVSTYKGVVTLRGHMHDNKIAQRVIGHARNVSGVQIVESRLEVHHH